MHTRGKFSFAVLFLCVASWAGAEELTGRVTSVSSGYIFQVDNNGVTELVAVSGITCPWTTSEAGARAKAFASKRILGKQVQMTVVERRGKVAHVKVKLPGGEDLAELLLSEGLATWNGRWSPDAERLQQFERQAKEKGAGVWAARGAKGPGASPPGQAGQVSLPPVDLPAAAPPPSSSKGLDDESHALSSTPRKVVLKGSREKDYSVPSPDNPALLAERQRKKKEREQALIERENLITEQGRNGGQRQGISGAGGLSGGYGRQGY